MNTRYSRAILATLGVFLLMGASLAVNYNITVNLSGCTVAVYDVTAAAPIPGSSPYSVPAGHTVTFTPTASVGGTGFEDWFLDVQQIANRIDGNPQTNNVLTLTNVQAVHTIWAYAGAGHTSVTASVVGGNGTVSPGTLTPWWYNNDYTFTATPNPGYQVNTWTYNGVLHVGSPPPILRPAATLIS